MWQNGWGYLDENVAERMGFEPMAHDWVTSFQDWLLKPLGHLSKAIITTHALAIVPERPEKVKGYFPERRTFLPGKIGKRPLTNCMPLG